jgi:hypothetical protein
MNTSFRAVVCLSVAALLALASAAPAGAQGSARGRRYTKGDVDRLIKGAENYSDRFKDYVDKRLDKSYLDGSRAEDRLNDQVSDLEKALDDLRGDFDRKDSWWETRSEVQDVTREAHDIFLLINRRRFPRQIQSAWAPLRRAINTLADVYELPRVGYGR